MINRSKKHHPWRGLKRLLLLVVTAPKIAFGGQAVMEGVMMRGPHSWAVAVRKVDGSIAIEHREIKAFSTKHAWARIPLIRGVVALLESLVIGMRALFVSSEYALQDEQENEAPNAESISASNEPADERPNPDALSTAAIALSMVVALGFSIALFKILPVSMVTLMPINRDAWAFVIIEALIKFAIFCAYLVIVGFLPDMRRVFQYHSAEHKAINAVEHGVALKPEAVNEMSRIHVRCGTAFVVWLFLIGLLVFRGAQLTFLAGAHPLAIIAARPLLLPLIAGLSFEILRFAGNHADNQLLRVLLAPGLWFQRLTTRPCTPEQCEVAIASLEAVMKHEEDLHRSGVDISDTDSDDAYRVLA